MTESDKANLRFIMGASDHVLRDWYDSIDDDDREYAVWLLTTARLDFKALMVDQLTDAHSDMQASREILSMFRN